MCVVAVDSRMMHISGSERSQLLLLPEAIDDYVAVDNPVRFIDAFVDRLDLKAAGFERVQAKATGRPGYAPGDLLKLYIYGYLNRVRSSRRLNLFRHELLAVDGTRIKVVNNKGRNFTTGSLQKFIEAVDKKLEDYLKRLDASDAEEQATSHGLQRFCTRGFSRYAGVNRDISGWRAFFCSIGAV